MPKFCVVVQHELERQECIVRLRGFSERVISTAPIELSDLIESWDEDGNLEFAFTAMGMRISGCVQTTVDQVTVDGRMPLAAAMFRGAIEHQIAEKIREVVS